MANPGKRHEAVVQAFRAPRPRPGVYRRWSHTCQTCQARTYSDRREAKAMIRANSWRGMKAYPCPTGLGWHAGYRDTADRAAGRTA